jgi:maltoporin
MIRSMKKIVLVLVLATLGQSAYAVTGDNFEYLGYMRTGVGTNLKGGDQNCYHQANVPGNEFRLGSECSIYGENLLRAYTNGAKSDKGEFFRSNFGFSYNPDGKRSGEPPNFYVFSAFIEAGRLNDSNSIIWVGKRFYRDGDLHIDDFFYFADTSGSGAGIEQIPLWNGFLAVSVMFEDSNSQDPAIVAPAAPATPTVTENGRPRTILLDVRLFDTKLTEHDRLNFWTGFATSTGGLDTRTNINYDGAGGMVAGVKYIHDLDQGYQKFAVVYGAGLLQGMNLGGSFGTDPTQTLGQAYNQNAHRIRFVEDAMWQPTKNFATAFGAVYENWSLQDGQTSGRWFSVGARPIYFFTDHYSLAFEAGASNVRQAGENGGKPMYRLTIAPQISPKPEFYARPVLRAFLTRTFLQGTSNALVSTATSVGFQGEVWF